MGPKTNNHRKRGRYDRELAELATTYEQARSVPVDALRTEFLHLASGPARFIGTGGSLTLAHLATRLHQAIGGELSAPLTPLGLIEGAGLEGCGAMLFSAQAKHPDARLVLEHLEAANYRPAVLVTHRDPTELDAFTGSEITVVQVPPPSIREGFLATNSVMAMASALTRAAGVLLPEKLLDGIETYSSPQTKSQQLLVVYPANLESVAIDLETRCSELGICSVQLADLRNIAHGRHTGLARRALDTTVLVLSSAASNALADKVSQQLERSGADQIRWHAEFDDAAACIRLLAVSMHAVGQMSLVEGIDAGRPRVPEFGRRLYRLPIRRLLAAEVQTPVSLKLAAIGADRRSSPLRNQYEEAFSNWSEEIRAVKFGSLVMDYDGTVCRTEDRRELPNEELRAELLRLLKAGVGVGFASGRGRSLHADLRRWIPKEYWPQIELGLYNGAVSLLLTEELADLREPSQLMFQVEERLKTMPYADLLTIEARSAQVSIEVNGSEFLQAGRLPGLVAEALASSPKLGVKVVCSAHSVDVIEKETSKVSVLERARERWDGEALALGDQGHAGGNDFELLAASRWSITVDRCSADPSRCWNVNRRGHRGPTALLAVLKTMRPRNGIVRLIAKQSKEHPRA